MDIFRTRLEKKIHWWGLMKWCESLSYEKKKVFDDIKIYLLDAAAAFLTVCSPVPEENFSYAKKSTDSLWSSM